MLGAAALLQVVESPRPRSGDESVGGPRVLRVRAPAVRRVELVGGTRRLDARRTRDGWQIDGAPATPETAEALDALVETLAHLRALDAFRAIDRAGLGLDPPVATIAIATDRRERRLLLGAPNASGSAIYAERQGHPRVFLVGMGLLSAIERVFYQRALARPGTA